MEIFCIISFMRITYFLGKGTYFEVFVHLFNLLIFCRSDHYHKASQLDQPMDINIVGYLLTSDSKVLQDS